MCTLTVHGGNAGQSGLAGQIHRRRALYQALIGSFLVTMLQFASDKAGANPGPPVSETLLLGSKPLVTASFVFAGAPSPGGCRNPITN